MAPGAVTVSEKRSSNTQAHGRSLQSSPSSILTALGYGDRNVSRRMSRMVEQEAANK